MKILVTGAKGFVGRNLVSQLRNIAEGKARWYPLDKDITVYEYDMDSTPEELDAYCADCDFVFNLAGVNRPQDPEEFMKGNFGFASTLLDTLKKHGNKCPVMLSSSIQATLVGRYADGFRKFRERQGVRRAILRKNEGRARIVNRDKTRRKDASRAIRPHIRRRDRGG